MVRKRSTYTVADFRVTDLAVSDLVVSYNKELLEVVNSVRGFSERASMICKFLRDTFSRSRFGIYKGEIYYFTGKIYEPCSNFAFRDVVSRFLERVRISPSLVLKYGDTKFLWEAEHGVCYHAIEPHFYLMAFRNCVVDMRTEEQMPHGPEHHCVYLHDYDFDMDAKCPVWKKFLKKVLPDPASRQILQMYISLALVDRSSTEMKVEDCLCCYGTGSNGKSVVFETICGLFGRENIGMSSLENILCRKGDEALRAASAIDGKRFLYCSEVGKVLDIGENGSMFKRFVSGEPIQGRLLGQDEYTVYNIPYLIMNVNSRLKTSESSHAVYRRLISLDFPVRIQEDEMDLGLAGKIAEEYSGVMAWVVRGKRNFRLNKYRFPRSRATEMAKFMQMAKNDSYQAWLGLKHIAGEQDSTDIRQKPVKVPVKELYANYIEFCEENGLEDLSLLRFGRKMTQYRFDRRKENNSISYLVYGDYDPRYVPRLKDRECFDMPGAEVDVEEY